MERYQLVPSFDYDSDDDRHDKDFWRAFIPPSNHPEPEGDPEGDGRSGRIHFRSDADDDTIGDHREPVYFPKRYGVDSQDDEIHYGYDHVTNSDVVSRTTVSYNGQPSYVTWGGQSGPPPEGDPRYRGLSFFDDMDSDDDDGALRGPGGRFLDTIDEENDEELLELESDTSSSSMPLTDDESSDEDNWVSVSDEEAMQIQRQDDASVVSSTSVDNDAMNFDSNGSAVMNWRDNTDVIPESSVPDR